MINTHKREGDRGREASESKRQMGHTHTYKDWYGKARKKIAEGDNRMFGIR